jgi:metallo-beta-lactamase class B
VKVSGWEGKTALSSTALPNVKVLSDSFYIPQLNTYRKVWIYLPNDYVSQPQKRYPVLYMHDGQNVFDVITSYSGEWGVDETLSSRQNKGDKGCIVVAVDHGGPTRIDEYSAYINARYGGGNGKQYCEFLVHTLKPFIDSAYRTLPQREYTAIAGSSLGGLISFYAAVTYPNIYSKAGIFSPSFWFSDSLYDYVNNLTKGYSMRFYLVAGTTESTDMVPDMERMITLLQSKGYTNDELMLVTKEDGQHSEWFWNREFGACYDWLFAGITTGLPLKEGEVKRVTVYPNPAGDSFSISEGATLVQLINTEGKELRQWRNIKTGMYLNTEGLPRGIYTVRILQHSTKLETKILLR